MAEKKLYEAWAWSGIDTMAWINMIIRGHQGDTGMLMPATRSLLPVFLESNPWAGYAEAPKTEARVAIFGNCLFVTMTAHESNPRREVTEWCGPVCTDSCMEFFVNPTPDASDEYLNFELNARGTLHLGIGKGRENRRHLVTTAEQAEIFRISTEIKEKEWSFALAIPDSFITKYYPTYATNIVKPDGETALGETATTILANFYKCGDATEQPHYSCWNPIGTERPDFHRPEFFAPIHFTVRDYP